MFVFPVRVFFFFLEVVCWLGLLDFSIAVCLFLIREKKHWGGEVWKDLGVRGGGESMIRI